MELYNFAPLLQNSGYVHDRYESPSFCLEYLLKKIINLLLRNLMRTQLLILCPHQLGLLILLLADPRSIQLVPDCTKNLIKDTVLKINLGNIVIGKTFEQRYEN